MRVFGRRQQPGGVGKTNLYNHRTFARPLQRPNNIFWSLALAIYSASRHLIVQEAAFKWAKPAVRIIFLVR
eukprot:5192942-Amphidinium_carterae.1